ncbi:hypothetical protein AAZX31_01G170200 [Glycine max]|uniref:RPW8 domain-containing protein n=1 Tax=Glycine max TaxID=3847 RepID=I1J939_SOYBN|nr:probable disease resistance protein At5g66900 [Glycine max]KAG5061151.1 hypothetical protein JHK87_002180 [Glycine soja]KAG5089572.1 hypothetical protein JHK86_002184 [Glycine max]KAH1267097.1 putative disease resistance protein [Glycine max]KRH76939.1 hypothetical protein GLYMA_01G183300v4 [Glycine max]|eukprot:XP_006573620.1 probable disease resistance protein At5g66900 [Glycine max]
MTDPLAGAAAGELLKGALEIIRSGYEFRPTLERSRETFDSLSSRVQKIKQLNRNLDSSTEEIDKLEALVRDGKELIDKYSKVTWWRFLCFPCYQCKLKASEDALTRHTTTIEPVHIRLGMMEIQSGIKIILQTLLMSGKENIGGAIEEPECIGMEQHLNKLKIELLKDGMSVLVLTGLPGSGKTTLAKKICWDTDIKGKFGVNIFVTVSKTPNLKSIVGTVFHGCRRPVPEFQSDDDAINRLSALLLSVGGNDKNPILLVLDDVWPGSEALVDKFTVQIPYYKILVTSRVAYPRFGTKILLGQLDHNQAVALFAHYAKLNDNSPYMPEEDLLHEIVRRCMGSPLVLKVTAGSLCGQPFEMWEKKKDRLQNQSKMEFSQTDLFCHLQQSLDALEDEFHINEKVCFMDLGLFPEDQRIPVPALIDMWAELYQLNNDGSKAMAIIHYLTTRNLINFIVTRKVAKDEDKYYNNHFVILHDLLRELAIRQSTEKPFEQDRLIIDITGNDFPEWWVGENQQGTIGQMFPCFSRMIRQKQLKVAARILCISTDETFNSDWRDMKPYNTEVLILNLHSSQYSLPCFTKKMKKLKVLIVTNYGFHRSEIKKFELLGSLSNLKRIRLEKVSVPSLCELKNLQKLSLRMCNTRQAFENCSIQISNAMPCLEEMSIDYCNDLITLPDGLCEISPLKKLSITNCHKLSALPQGIGKLENLEVLRLCSCSDLLEMPNSFEGLNKLSCLDISDCVSLTKLPDDIGELKKLKKLYMKGSKLGELPYSVHKFEQFKHEINVICDEETVTLWENFRAFPNLKIEIFREDIDLNWLHGVHS